MCSYSCKTSITFILLCGFKQRLGSIAEELAVLPDGKNGELATSPLGDAGDVTPARCDVCEVAALRERDSPFIAAI